MNFPYHPVSVLTPSRPQLSCVGRTSRPRQPCPSTSLCRTPVPPAFHELVLWQKVYPKPTTFCVFLKNQSRTPLALLARTCRIMGPLLPLFARHTTRLLLELPPRLFCKISSLCSESSQEVDLSSYLLQDKPKSRRFANARHTCSRPRFSRRDRSRNPRPQTDRPLGRRSFVWPP